MIKSIKTLTKKSIPEKLDVRVILISTILSSQFNIKDDTNKKQKHDLVYFSRSPSTTCADSYIAETAMPPSERVGYHDGRVMKPHVVRHCLNSNHKTVNTEHFKILNMGYNKKKKLKKKFVFFLLYPIFKILKCSVLTVNNNTYRRRISETLFVKQYRPSLNAQDNSVTLELFN